MDEIIEEGESFIDDEEKAKRWCLKGLCPNVLNRYSLSKKAVKAGNDVVNLLGKRFDGVSYRLFHRGRNSCISKSLSTLIQECQNWMIS